MSHDSILIIDFGSQVTQLIARRVREAHVYCEVVSSEIDAETLKQFDPKGIILSGSHMSAYEDNTDRIPDCVLKAGVPILGICYGMQTMAQQLGGQVENGKKREFGYAEICPVTDSLLFADMKDFTSAEGDAMLKVWMSHGDKVVALPPGFRTTALNASCPIAAMEDSKRDFYAVQFHPEVTHTVSGRRLIENFLFRICRAEASWSMDRYAELTIEQIRVSVGSDRVILGLSGGVDSSVAAVLIHRAIGKQLTCVFVDNGLLRLNERAQVEETFRKNLGIELIVVDASRRFLNALLGVTDPETKRKIIGREFVAVFQEEAKKIQGAKWLAQGTIYPDVIESAAAKTKKAKTIKSHHNVGGLPKDLGLKLLEPLRTLFKDEVRELGIELGLPAAMVYRHPFPGPGLGVRILGEVKSEYADLLRKADAIFIEELRRSGWYEKVSQAFVVFLPVKSVGVMGDGRTYDYVVSLRAVETTDFMTAKWAELPYPLLGQVSNRIINEVRGINRVVYDISGKPPSTIEWE